MAGLGVGSTLLGGVGALGAQKSASDQKFVRSNQTGSNTAASKAKKLLSKVFGAIGPETAQAATIPTYSAANDLPQFQNTTGAQGQSIPGLDLTPEQLNDPSYMVQLIGSGTLSDAQIQVAQQNYYSQTLQGYNNPYDTSKLQEGTGQAFAGIKNMTQDQIIQQMLDTGTDLAGNPLSQQQKYNLQYSIQTGLPLDLNGMNIPGVVAATNVPTAGKMSDAGQYQISASGMQPGQAINFPDPQHPGQNIPYYWMLDMSTGKWGMVDSNNKPLQENANGDWTDPANGFTITGAQAGTMQHNVITYTMNSLQKSNPGFDAAVAAIQKDHPDLDPMGPNGPAVLMGAQLLSQSKLPTPYTHIQDPSGDAAVFAFAPDYIYKLNLQSYEQAVNTINQRRYNDFQGAIGAWIENGGKGPAPQPPPYAQVDTAAFDTAWNTYANPLTAKNGIVDIDKFGQSITSFISNLGSYNAMTGQVTGGPDSSLGNLGFDNKDLDAIVAANNAAAAAGKLPVSKDTNQVAIDQQNQQAILQALSGSGGSPGGSQAQAQAPLTSISVSPGTGKAGDVVTITGSGFSTAVAAFNRVQLMDAATGKTVVKDIAVTSATSSTLKFTVPADWAPGSYQIRGNNIGATSGFTYTASVPFTVNAPTGGGGSGGGVTTPVIAAVSLPAATVGTAYAAPALSVSNMIAPAWTVSSGSLPAGLTLSSATGAISGIPTTQGTSTFTVQASAGGQTATQQFSITVSPVSAGIGAPTITNTNFNFGSGTIGTQNVTVPITITGTNFTTSTSVTADSSSGLTISGIQVNSAGTQITANVIISPSTPSGSSTQPGLKIITINNGTGSVQGFFLVNAATGQLQVPTITTASLPSVIAGNTYSQTLQASNFSGAVTWTLASGTLPTGLSLSSAGVISGTVPSTSAVGSVGFTVSATDGTNTVRQNLSINVTSPSTVTGAPTITGTTGNSGSVGQSNIPLVINGTNLTGATLAAGSGSGLTITGVQINSLGTQLTATVAVSGSANTGVQGLTLSNGSGATQVLFNITAAAQTLTLSTNSLTMTSNTIASVQANTSTITATSLNPSLVTATVVNNTIVLNAVGTVPSTTQVSVVVHPTTVGNASQDQVITVFLTGTVAGTNQPAGGYGNVSTFASVNNQPNNQSFAGLQMPAGYDSGSQQGLQMQDVAGAQTQGPSLGSYTVKKGDTLWNIAKKYYGDGSKWRVILAANPSALSKPGNTRTLKIGAVLNIPSLNQ